MRYFNAKFITSYAFIEQMPQSDNIEIVFAGRSNVGKSSMINKLFNKKNLARVSSVPGKTATINFYAVDDVNFVDLPGYGYAKVSKSEQKRFKKLIEDYFKANRNIGLIILLIDMRHGPSTLDLKMVNFFIDAELPFIILLTKSDKIKKSQRDKMLKIIKSELPFSDQIEQIPFSSQTGEGVDKLRELIDYVCDDE